MSWIRTTILLMGVLGFGRVSMPAEDVEALIGGFKLIPPKPAIDDDLVIHFQHAITRDGTADEASHAEDTPKITFHAFVDNQPKVSQSIGPGTILLNKVEEGRFTVVVQVADEMSVISFDVGPQNAPTDSSSSLPHSIDEDAPPPPAEDGNVIAPTNSAQANSARDLPKRDHNESSPSGTDNTVGNSVGQNNTGTTGFIVRHEFLIDATKTAASRLNPTQTRELKNRIDSLRLEIGSGGSSHGEQFRRTIAQSDMRDTGTHSIWPRVYIDLRDGILAESIDTNDLDAWRQTLRKISDALNALLRSETGYSNSGQLRYPVPLTDPVEYEAPEDGTLLAWWLPLFALLACGLLLVQAASRTVEPIVHDSQDFKEALDIWHDVIAIDCRTPRAFKRFVNRLRFSAMRIRPPGADPTHFDLFTDYFRKWIGLPTKASQQPIAWDQLAGNEAVIVALTAILQADRTWLDDDRHWSWLQSGCSGRAPAGLDPTQRNTIRDAIAMHKTHFGFWSPHDSLRESLRSVAVEDAI